MKMPPKEKLTQKQEIFVSEYLVDYNGTRAAKAAGYSSKTAESTASRLLRVPKIEAAIGKATRERLETLTISGKNMLRELANLAFMNAGDFFKWSQDEITIKDSKNLTRAQQACVAEASHTKRRDGTGTVKIRLHDKNGPLFKLIDLFGRENLGIDDNRDDEASSGDAKKTRDELAERVRSRVENATKDRG